MDNYLVIDCENNNNPHTQYGRQAGNFLYDKIVAIGVTAANECPISWLADNSIENSGGIGKILHSYELLVGHNIKHDLLFLWKGKRLQNWFKNGGKIWDTQLAEYILSGQQHKYPALRDIAVNKYGCPERQKLCEPYWNNVDNFFNVQGYIKTEEIKNEYSDYYESEYAKINCTCFTEEEENLDRCLCYEDLEVLSLEDYAVSKGYIKKKFNIQTSDIPKNLVLEDVKNDVIDTETIFLKQYEEVQKRNLLPLIEGQMDFLLAVIEIEYNGMKIDKEVFNKNKIELELKLEQKKKQFLEMIKPYWRVSNEFSNKIIK